MFLRLCYILTIIFLVFSLLILEYVFINNKKHENYNCEYNEPQFLSSIDVFDKKISNLELKEKNKIVIIGDSRFDYIVLKKDVIKIPDNYIMIAKSGASYEWFYYEALNKLYKILNKKTDVNYYVVMNVGVNDIQFNGNYQPALDKYIKTYNDLASKYSNVDFYLLSINPINEEKLNYYQPQNIRTNKKIEDFNNQLLDSIENIDNLYYCDSYHDIYFHTEDGLHYTDKTGQDTINYIKDECVKYK
ncbi:MAG: hypothetical protein IKE75_06310 [Bacilli bacterium]|nr:hypothetical protein [Bacilli bacterium]